MFFSTGNQHIVGTFFFHMLAEKNISSVGNRLNSRLLYKRVAFLVLHRIERTLELPQFEDQLGFCLGRRMEEHLLSACLVFDTKFLKIYFYVECKFGPTESL